MAGRNIHPMIKGKWLLMVKEVFYFVHQFVDVLKLPVNGGKSYVGNLIEFSQG